MSWWDEISPFSGVGATAALLFVVLVSAVKAGLEDYKRHVEDNITNNTPTTIVSNLETGKAECTGCRSLQSFFSA